MKNYQKPILSTNQTTYCEVVNASSGNPVVNITPTPTPIPTCDNSRPFVTNGCANRGCGNYQGEGVACKAGKPPQKA